MSNACKVENKMQEQFEQKNIEKTTSEKVFQRRKMSRRKAFWKKKKWWGKMLFERKKWWGKKLFERKNDKEKSCSKEKKNDEEKSCLKEKKNDKGKIFWKKKNDKEKSCSKEKKWRGNVRKKVTSKDNKLKGQANKAQIRIPPTPCKWFLGAQITSLRPPNRSARATATLSSLAECIYRIPRICIFISIWSKRKRGTGEQKRAGGGLEGENTCLKESPDPRAI